MISDKSIEEVKLRVDIVDVIGDYVSLKKAGANYKALSPFTDEKTPSFFVSPAKGIFKCFSTGKGGDAINFLEENNGMSYLETIRYLAEKYDIELEETNSPEADASRSEREALYIILGFARDQFKDLLQNNEEGKSIGLSYFRERGLNDATIDKFDLGYALDRWDYLLKTAAEKGYNEELLEKSGLIIVKDDGKKYDRFRGRTIFPIHDISGRVIAFGARILKTEKNQPKYINSPETEVYTKSKVLYGLYQAKNEIRKENNCYLVEGYTDVTSLYQAGVKNVVASSGTALSTDQINLIGRYTDNITVLFDGDRAGIQASLRGIDMILEQGLNVRIVEFPEGEDPDSYLKQVGTTAFTKFLTESKVDFVSYKASLFAEQVGTDPALKAEAIREIVLSISKMPDPMKRAVYLKESASIFDLDESILVAEANKQIITRRRQKKDKGQIEDIPPPTEEFTKEVSTLNIDEVIIDQERACLRLLLNYGNEPQEDYEFYYHYFFQETEDVEFLDSVVAEMIRVYKKNVQENKFVDYETFIQHKDNAVRNLTADLYFEKYTLSENWLLKYKIIVLKESQNLEHVFTRNILLLKYRMITKTLNEEKAKLKEAKDQKEEEEILQHLWHYKKFHMEYANELGIVLDQN